VVAEETVVGVRIDKRPVHYQVPDT
jgi:hypothetical protein